jgi:cyclophilin family peptidyl-prolyl cis-trans isomerase
MKSFIFTRSTQKLVWAAVAAGGFALVTGPARGVTLSLWTNSIVMPENQTFQMPITASDPDGQPLHFGATVSNKKLAAVFAPSSNPSLLFTVSGVDSNNNPFTNSMTAQLFEDLTPTTAIRIVTLVTSNFYDGLLFQRVISGFVAQGGGATNNPNLESGVKIDDEYAASLIYDGFGQLAMANQASANNTGTHDSNDSQFFITDVDLSIANTNKASPQFLNFEQPIFGQLTSGFNVLAQIMSTPVGPNPDNPGEISAPLSNVVINALTVITNSQDAVLRLTGAPKFLGTVTVTVSATNAENQVAIQAFQVSVVTDTNTSPPFLGSIPSSATVSQNMSTSFLLTATNITGGVASLNVEDIATGAFPTNVVLDRNKKTGLVTISPDTTLTGTVQLLFEVTDNIHQPDTHQFKLNVLPGSPTPTMTIVPLRGAMVDSKTLNSSHITVTGTFAFNSQSDQTFRSNDVIALSLGDLGNPLSVSITPDDPGWQLHNGTISGKAQLSSSTSSKVQVFARFDPANHTFALSVSGFNFPSPGLTNNNLQVGVSIGTNYGEDVRPWVETSPGVFEPPVPLK